MAGFFSTNRLLLHRLLFFLPWPVRLPWGGYWWAGNDRTNSLIFQRSFEENETKFLLRFLKPGITVLDIGAHRGYYTLLASKEVGLKGKVFAFEPSSRELGRLRWHVFINCCQNVRIVPLALGNYEGKSEFFICLGKETGCNSLRLPMVSEPVKKVTVQMTKIDAFLESYQIGQIDFMKLDVEGAELEVLRGAEKCLSTLRPIIMCELSDLRTKQWGYSSREIYVFLTQRGYQWFLANPDGRLEICPAKEVFNENLFAVPNEKLSLISDFKVYKT